MLVNEKSANTKDGYGYGYGYDYKYQYGYGYQPAYAETRDEAAKPPVAALPPADESNGVHAGNGHS